MKMIQNYVRAKSLEEAYQLNQKRNNAIVGGMLWMKMQTGNLNTAIDLGDLGLDRIEETEDAFLIGAMVTLRQIEQHESLNACFQNAPKQAVGDIVGVQFRNLATVGGSIWGRYGFSDVLTVFLALDSYVELYHGGVVSLEEFSKMKYDRDILVRLIVKKTPARICYQTMRAQRTDFPVLTCAVSVINGEYRAVIGARPGRARLVRDAEGIMAGPLDEKKAESFAVYVQRAVPFSSNMRGSAAYRAHLAKTLVTRGVMTLKGDAAE